MIARRTIQGVFTLMLTAAAACGASGADGGSDQGAATEATGEASLAVTRARACSGATIFAPGEISLPGRGEHRIAFSRDGKTAYFRVSLDAYPWERLVSSRREGGRWAPAETLPFSGTYNDTDVFLTEDGRTLYFSTDRPVNAGEPIKDDFDVWAVDREGAGWGAPYHLGAEINTPTFHELYPSLSRDGTIYFNSNRPGGLGEWDIYRARATCVHARGFAAAENLGPAVNSAAWEYNPWISPDGRFLVFASLNRAGGFGLGDLYGATRVGDGFAPAHNLGAAVNSAADEYHPTIDADLRHVYFARQTYETPTTTSDLYVAETTCLDLR